MLPIHIPPHYDEVIIRPIVLPRDMNDLIAIHKKYDILRPNIKMIETLYSTFLGWSVYGAYLVSSFGKPLFLLELIPVDLTDFFSYYEPHPYDYSIRITLGIGPDQVDEALEGVLISLEGIFAANPEIHRLVLPVTYTAPPLLKILIEKAGFGVLKEPLDQESPGIYIYCH